MVTGKWIINLTHRELKGRNKGKLSHSIFYYDGDLTPAAILSSWKQKFSFGGGVEDKFQPVSSTVSYHKDPEQDITQFIH